MRNYIKSIHIEKDPTSGRKHGRILGIHFFEEHDDAGREAAFRAAVLDGGSRIAFFRRMPGWEDAGTVIPCSPTDHAFLPPPRDFCSRCGLTRGGGYKSPRVPDGDAGDPSGSA